MAKPNIHNTSSGDIRIQSEIKTWGNSLGIRIPKEIRGDLNLIDGSKIIISLDRKNKKITIKNLAKSGSNLFDLAKDLKLEYFTKKITKKNQPSENCFPSNVIGNEVW